MLGYFPLIDDHLLVFLLLSSAQGMQLSADSGFVISQIQSRNFEHPPLNGDHDGIVTMQLPLPYFTVSFLLCPLLNALYSVSSPSLSLRQASCHTGNPKGRSLTVLLQFSFPSGKTWQRLTWVTTASRQLTDLWWVTPIQTLELVCVWLL